MKYKYALFDLDGTLTDPAPGITNCIMYALRKFGITPPPREALYKFIGPPLLYSFKEYCGFSEKDAELAVAYYRERFSDVGLFENEIYPGIRELLSELCESGTKVVLATSKPDVYSKRILEHFDIDKYFYFLAANTLTESRPEKSDVIAYAIESCKIKVPAEAVIFLAEAAVYRRFFTNCTASRATGYAVAANLCSAVVGYAIMEPVWRWVVSIS